MVRLGVPYLRITLIGGIMMFLSMTLGSIFRAGGDSVTPMIVMIVSTVLKHCPGSLADIWYLEVPTSGRCGIRVCKRDRQDRWGCGVPLPLFHRTQHYLAEAR